MKVIERENEIVCDFAGCGRQGKYRLSGGGSPGDDLVLCGACAEAVYSALSEAFGKGEEISGIGEKKREIPEKKSGEDEKAGKSGKKAAKPEGGDEQTRI